LPFPAGWIISELFRQVAGKHSPTLRSSGFVIRWCGSASPAQMIAKKRRGGIRYKFES